MMAFLLQFSVWLMLTKIFKALKSEKMTHYFG